MLIRLPLYLLQVVHPLVTAIYLLFIELPMAFPFRATVCDLVKCALPLEECSVFIQSSFRPSAGHQGVADLG